MHWLGGGLCYWRRNNEKCSAERRSEGRGSLIVAVYDDYPPLQAAWKEWLQHYTKSMRFMVMGGN